MKGVRFFVFLLFLLGFTGVVAKNNNALNKSLKEYTVGVMLSARGDCESAIPHFEKALSYNKNIHIYFELADCYKSLSEMEKTIEYLEFATKEFPDNPEGYLRLGDYYSDLVQALKSPEIVKKSLENYEKAFELSNDYEIVYKIIEANFLLQDFDAVLKYYQKLPDSFKNDYYTLFYVSVAYNSKKDRFNLFLTLKRLSRINIDNPRILNELVDLSMKNNFYLFAYKFSLNFKRIYRDYNDWDRLFLSGLMAKKYKEIVDIFNKELKSPTGISVYCVATAYGYLNNYEESAKYYQMLLKSNKFTLPESLGRDIYLDYIRILLAMKKYKTAYKETLNYEKIYGLSPDSIIKERFESLLLQGKYKDAKKVLYVLKITSDNKKAVARIEKLFEKNPKLLGYDYLASLYYSLGDYNKAIYYFAKCDKLSPKDVVYIGALALCYQNVGNEKMALKTYKKAYKRFPDDAVILNNYAYFLIDLNIDLEKGLELAKKAVEKKPNVESYRDTLGYGYLKMGDIEKAEENLMFAYKRSPDNPDICLHLGDLYFKKGNYEKAKEFWLDAIDFGIKNVKEVKDRLNSISSD